MMNVAPSAPLLTKSQAASKASHARRNGGRNAMVDPTTCNKDYSGDLAEFLKAVDAYLTSQDRRFVANSEIYDVLMSLGYKKG